MQSPGSLSKATTLTTACVCIAATTAFLAARFSQQAVLVFASVASRQLSMLVFACRIWNHHRQACVLKRQLTDDPVDLSVHCSGLTILIAYSDKVQMLYILRYCSLHSQA